MGNKTKEVPSDVAFHVFIIQRVEPGYVLRPVTFWQRSLGRFEPKFE